MLIDFNLENMLKGKKAQVGETMTWIVATLIIVVILSFSVYLVSGGGVLEDLGFKDGKSLDYSKPMSVNSLTGKSLLLRSVDFLTGKSLLGYLLTRNSLDKKVFNQLIDEKNLSDFSGDLSKKIFWDFYFDSEFQRHENNWLGIFDKSVKTKFIFGPFGETGWSKNNFFKVPSACEVNHEDSMSLDYQLDKDKFLVVCILRRFL